MKMTPTVYTGTKTNNEVFGMKIAIGSGMAVFLMGALFWAGATYNRIQGIEAHLLNIDSAISKIGDIQTVAEREAETQRRLDKLEDEVRQKK